MALQRRSRTSAADRARARGSFAAVVTARRHELDLTQGELGDLAGVARGSIVALEAGRTVTLDVLIAVLEVLGLHLELTRGSTHAGLDVSTELAQQYHLDARVRPSADTDAEAARATEAEGAQS